MPHTSSIPKTLVVLKHSKGKGKTESIREFAKKLVSTFTTFKPIYPPSSVIPPKGDFRLVIEIHGKTIGIESQGDPNTNLEGRLIELSDFYSCDIIVGACRTKGETIEAVNNLKNIRGYQIIWTSSYETTNRTLHALANEIKGNHILDILQKIGII